MKPLSIINKIIFVIDIIPTIIFNFCGINFVIDAIDRGFFEITDVPLFFQTVAITLAWNSQLITYITAMIVRKKTNQKSFLTQLPYLSDFLSIIVGFTPLLQSV